MPKINETVYLGDGLYAEFDGWQVRLYAYDGVSATNEVFLEPEVLLVFEKYIKNLKDKVTASVQAR